MSFGYVLPGGQWPNVFLKHLEAHAACMKLIVADVCFRVCFRVLLPLTTRTSAKPASGSTSYGYQYGIHIGKIAPISSHAKSSCSAQGPWPSSCRTVYAMAYIFIAACCPYRKLCRWAAWSDASS
eukprot:217321-Pleurochrysis_carterae.AAC.2